MVPNTHATRNIITFCHPGGRSCQEDFHSKANLLLVSGVMLVDVRPMMDCNIRHYMCLTNIIKLFLPKVSNFRPSEKFPSCFNFLAILCTKIRIPFHTNLFDTKFDIPRPLAPFGALRRTLANFGALVLGGDQHLL